MDFKKQLHDYIQEHEREIVDTLKELIKIPSVRGEVEENAPFGRECARMLEFTKKLYDDNGFDTELDVNGGYLLSYYGAGKKSLGLFAHADVVPVGDDWTLTSPFEPLEKDGYIIGRGAIDDKSAVVISLFCARILKELNIPFTSRLILFTGSSEESGMGDIKNYLKAHTPPDFSLVADTAFPLYKGNKGRILLKATKNSAIGELKSFIGGKAGANVAEATARMKYAPTLYEWLKSEENERTTVKRENDEIVISVVGIGKHTALPEGSVNAAVLIAKVLCECELLSEDTHQTLRFIHDICSDYYGACLGIDNDDAEFGKLTFVNYQIHANECLTELHFNIRHGLSISQSEIKERLTSEFEQRGYEIAFLDTSEPHIVPKDHPMLRALMDVYVNYTGKTDAQMYVNAGGTYGQLLPCAAEIGTSIGGGKRPFELPSGHGSVHQPDECISIDGLLNSIELTMLMLLECDKQHEDRTMEPSATIFDIQRNSYVDGPGIRTTIFFKGCNLRCAWCHNPESQNAVPQMLFYKNKCTGCGKCKEKCPTALEKCELCGMCTIYCPHDAREICGREYSVDEVFREVIKDKTLYENSGGGVTFSGGECMLQIDFLEEILRECKKNGIHTAVDTAGHVPYEHFERIMPYADLFLYDVKCFDSVKHKQYTGVGNELVLENLKKLLATDTPLWIRIPIIPTVNDTEKEMQRIKEYIFSCGSPQKIELLPYHAMGEHKYAAINKEIQGFPVPSEEKMKQLKNIFP